MNSRLWGTVFVGFALLLGVCVGAGLAWMAIARANPNIGTEIQLQDANGDGMPDIVYIYEFGELVRCEVDRNFDGDKDEEYFYQGRLPARSESDDNFDGAVDTWITYSNGVASRADVDTNFDGQPNKVESYTDGVIQEARWLRTGQERAFRRLEYRHGRAGRDRIDTTGDGIFDRIVTYDPIGRPRSPRQEGGEDHSLSRE